MPVSAAPNVSDGASQCGIKFVTEIKMFQVSMCDQDLVDSISKYKIMIQNLKKNNNNCSGFSQILLTEQSVCYRDIHETYS